MKNLIKYFFIALSFLVISSGVLAADYDVNCNVSGCIPSTIVGFFPSTEVWYPGKTYQRTIKITNTSGSTQKVVIDSENEIATRSIDKVVQYTITNEDKTTPWDNSLYAFYSNGETQLLDNFLNGASHTFTFTGNMYTTAGNEYQDKETQHDLIIGYQYNPTPTPGQCTSSKPNTPGPSSINKITDSEIKLSWGEIGGTFTGYKITWSQDKDTDGEGEGAQYLGKTTEVNITGLELNKYGYYFKVRAINDCKESDPNEIIFTGAGPDLRITTTPTPTGTVLGLSTYQTGSTTGFEEGILGEATESAKLATPSALESGSVQGINDIKNCTSCIWWPILLGELLALIIFYYFITKDKLTKKTYIIAFLIPTITYIIFYLLNKPCAQSFWSINSNLFFCKHFILFDLGLYGLTSFTYKSSS